MENSKPVVQLALTPPPRPIIAGSEEVILSLEGMHCAGCVTNVERALHAVPGVTAARVNLALHEAKVLCDLRRTTIDELRQAVSAAGYRAQLASHDSIRRAFGTEQDRQLQMWRSRFLFGVTLLIPLLIGHYGAAHDNRGVGYFQAGLACAIYLTLGLPYLQSAWRQSWRGTANMDTLIAVGTLAAIVAGGEEWFRVGHTMYFLDAAMILVFITLGKWLESLAQGRTSQAIRRLLEISPSEATVVRSGQTQVVSISSVRIGETLVVAPGQRVPLDARVLSGSSAVDQSWLTGESLPVDKQPGDTIWAGTVNGAGALTTEVTAVLGQTSLDRVIDLVRRAQQSQPPIERFADAVVRRFVPAVLTLAGLTLLGWGLVGNDWQTGVSAMVAVLVVACPCAMGLATPTAVLVASGTGAEQGILIKDAAALETLAQVTQIVLDKTGTVTAGYPQLVAIEPASGTSTDALLSLAAAVERLSAHPLGKCIVAAADSRQLTATAASELQVVAGQGVTARWQGQLVAIGNERLLQARGIDLTSLPTSISAHRARGETVLIVATDRYQGLLAVADPILDTSRSAIEALRQLRLPVTIFSGDHAATVSAVAGELAVTSFTAEMLPTDKAAQVERLREQGAVVVFVGDGINDAPAMAVANVGVALGTGADVAIESAQLVLAKNDLRGVVQAVHLARATLRVIRQNLAWAFGYNLLLLPLATGIVEPLTGWRLPPIAASIAMASSSVSVVANSLRLRYIFRVKKESA